MAGTYLKSDDIYKAFSSWLDESLRSKGDDSPLAAHVSSFFKEHLPKKRLLEYSIEIFLELVSALTDKERVDEFKPVLVIPLGYSEGLCVWDNSVNLDDQMSDEPPSIYLLERDKEKYLEVVEEYKVPVDIDCVEGADFNIYYRCFRDITAIENDWEFNKAVYIEYYPKHLI